jgi:hypothetical protein
MSATNDSEEYQDKDPPKYTHSDETTSQSSPKKEEKEAKRKTEAMWGTRRQTMREINLT